MSPAIGRERNYGGRAKAYRIGTPTDSGVGVCGHGVYTGPRTSCALARNLHSVFTLGERRLGHAPGWVLAAASSHARAQRFSCEIALNDHAVVCYARTGALVDFAYRKPG